MKNKGFTLVELLAVISILGVIMVFTIPSFLDAFNKSKHKLEDYEQEDIIEAAKTYITDIDLNAIDYVYDGDTAWPATGSSIRNVLGYSGTTYTKGMKMQTYDFRLYLNDVGGIELSIKDLVANGYYDEDCDYDNANKVKDCNIKDTCKLKVTIESDTNDKGYLETKSYSAEIISGCEKN